ncbi:K(+)/H(+) antiporter NhaP [Tsuneonella dongtanensis]|uniref:K(+)/H(+) antiporter NhaP n=1 Tax=Tsuneonella dongtanensis TaxID=692370 RepID=A0A1B2ABA1_9SPHN|nr:cation:proton antiporter [Tsuneonella dongtanensis]ANY19439.1 K(+)/H(+) antiporter NhaP [Tsuneonella dongtanensis]
MIPVLSEAATIAAQAPRVGQHYFELMFGLGALILFVAWAPLILKKLPLSLPIICVGIGIAVFSLEPFSAWAPHPDKTPKLVERATELIVIVSLMGGGLKIERALSWRRWNVTWRLLGIAMPITIALVMLLGHTLLGLGLATALLLGGSLAPTDPVLAGDVQIEHDEEEDEAEAKFALTSEAGLNDALAFPFVHLAIAIAAAGGLTLDLLADWALKDVLWKLSVGALVGAGLGWLVGYIIYRLPGDTSLSRTGDGFIALGATLVVYTVTEFVHGYGFLAVFVAGLAIRRASQEDDFNRKLHDFADESERLMMMLLLLLFGGMIAGGLLADIGWEEALFAAVMLLVIRPLAGWIGLLGVKRPPLELAIIAFFGIRGLGSVYYLSYGFNHGTFDYEYSLWGTLGLIIAASILMHGVLVTPALKRLGAHYRSIGMPTSEADDTVPTIRR